MCMDMLTCCRLQPRRPHLESRVPRHTEPQARCASPPHRRPTFARSCTRWGWARRRAARWPCSRASRGSTMSRTLYKPRRSLRSEADIFWPFKKSIGVSFICDPPHATSKYQAQPPPSNTLASPTAATMPPHCHPSLLLLHYSKDRVKSKGKAYGYGLRQTAPGFVGIRQAATYGIQPYGLRCTIRQA